MCNNFSILRKFKTKIMAKRKRKSNLKDTSFEITPDMRELLDQQEAIDPMQIDIEDQIEEEEKEYKTVVEEKEYPKQLTRFKDPTAGRDIPNNSYMITNENITTGDIEVLINSGICSEDEFC